jgi:hypothetical protein
MTAEMPRVTCVAPAGTKFGTLVRVCAGPGAVCKTNVWVGKTKV